MELERLATRLAANRNPGALSLEGVDGLFCALIASPTMVGPSEYLGVIFGEGQADSAVFADESDARDTLSLLMRLWNDIARDFKDETAHLPYMEEAGTDGITGRDWARGFMRGTRLATQGWSRLFSDDQEGLPIARPMVAGELDPDWPKEPLTPEKAEDALKSMLAGAARAYRYFAPDRKEFAAKTYQQSSRNELVQPFVRSEPKVGRNDPCPCGSGRKFKKCCGASDLNPVQ